MAPEGQSQAIILVEEALEYFHTDPQRWQKELESAREELDIVISMLDDLVVLLSDTDLLADLEHYQNLFIRERELVDTLLHKVWLHDKEAAHLAEDFGTLFGYFDMQKHMALGNEIVKFIRLNTERWYTFNKFILRVFWAYAPQNQ